MHALRRWIFNCEVVASRQLGKTIGKRSGKYPLAHICVRAGVSRSQIGFPKAGFGFRFCGFSELSMASDFNAALALGVCRYIFCTHWDSRYFYFIFFFVGNTPEFGIGIEIPVRIESNRLGIEIFFWRLELELLRLLLLLHSAWCTPSSTYISPRFPFPFTLFTSDTTILDLLFVFEYRERVYG